MKKRGIFFTAALLAVLAFASCNNGSTGEPTKFEGRWLDLAAISQGYTDFSYTFSGINFTFNQAGSAAFTMSGTFTFTDTEITFVTAEFGTWVQPYTLRGNVLDFPGTGNNVPIGEFTKQ